MTILNFEFKAKTDSLEEYERKLLGIDPKFIGEDNQTDTYFNVQKGRLKLREGNIENALIYYERPNASSAKQSNVLLYKYSNDETLKNILTNSSGIKVVVTKKRKIYFVDNVKIHFDTIKELGTFIEVEAISTNGEFTVEQLKAQCDTYASFFNIQPEDYIPVSYSDLILEKEKR
jgi:adenylate cyclase class 2